MDVKNKPSTPLPWDVFGVDQHVMGNHLDDANARKVAHGQWTHNMEAGDASYAKHAANSYPRLVEALQGLVDDLTYDTTAKYKGDGSEPLRALLRELGEA